MLSAPPALRPAGGFDIGTLWANYVLAAARVLASGDRAQAGRLLGLLDETWSAFEDELRAFWPQRHDPRVLDDAVLEDLLDEVGVDAPGYAAAETLAQVLKQCGNDLSRENVMKQAAALKDYQGSMMLPGIKISTGPWNFRPIKHLRLIQFDGRTWQPIGDVLETAFSNTQK